MNIDVETSGAAVDYHQLRKTNQPLMPHRLETISGDDSLYNIYPFHSLGAGKIGSGYAGLSEWISTHRAVMLDGYAGIFWNEIRKELDDLLRESGRTVEWVDMAGYLKGEAETEAMVAPFMGASGSVWGTKADLSLSDFYRRDLEDIEPDGEADLTIIYGPGAALAGWDAPVVYFDLPKNELQYRMRAGAATNLGSGKVTDNVTMYKRFYFIDWVVLNAHKERILDRITVIADTQWQSQVNWMLAADLREGLKKLSGSVFRVRPWFEPGAWGGQWMKENIPGLNPREVNYAWSFEFIVPENGIVFESDRYLLEVSFDFLMFAESRNVLGRHAGRFGTEFPIRFDFLDTVKGGNLSIQCHPTLDYIRREFGENFTQDETYYILEADRDASVYIGFQEEIDPARFRRELEHSQETGEPVDIDQHVMCLPSKKHDLFLIPNGTVHSAAAGNLVLEISATPYIFTFKMYDWVRLDLNGKPRPINIEHAFRNLNFERKGKRVIDELVSKPCVLRKDEDSTLYHLPTHTDHFYDVHRIEFSKEVEIETEQVCHVMMLVEGSSVEVIAADGTRMAFSYAETFVVPAAAGRYRLINRGAGVARVVKAFVKY